jgi:hypothetical protein
LTSRLRSPNIQAEEILVRNLRLALLLATLLPLGLATRAAQSLDPIPQGEFASRLVDRSHLQKPEGGWTAATAIPVLSRLGISPMSGMWAADADLTERDLTHLLRYFGIFLYTTRPDARVTYLRATLVLNEYSDVIRRWKLAAFTLDESTTTHIDTDSVAGLQPLPPGSPATPCCPCPCEDVPCLERMGLAPPRK